MALLLTAASVLRKPSIIKPEARHCCTPGREPQGTPHCPLWFLVLTISVNEKLAVGTF